MNGWHIVYILAFVIEACVMNHCGYSVRTWENWVVWACLLLAGISGINMYS